MYAKMITVKGDRINSQVIGYELFSEKEISEAEIDKIKQMRESEFLLYVENSKNIKRCERLR